MSKRRKNVTQSVLQQDVELPSESQRIVMALGTRGGNIVEVRYPCGRETLCMLPARFNKKLWVRRGGFLVVDDSAEASAGGDAITGTIAAVLYEEHVKQLKKLPGIWPPEFDTPATSSASDAAPAAATSSSRREGGAEARGGGSAGSDDDDDADDDDLPPLHQNNNRRVIEYEVSSSEEEEDQEGGEQALAKEEGSDGEG